MSYSQFRDTSTTPLVNSLNNNVQHPFIEKAEDFANKYLSKSKHILPHIGKLCLCSTFIEDGIRMLYQWTEQRDYINTTWGVGWFISCVFVLINLVGQIGASLMVLSKKQVNLACYSLCAIILLQTIAYSILWDLKFLARSLSLVGAVLLILAENRKDSNKVFHQMPMMNDPNKSTKSYMQLSGRILLVLMFLSLLRFSANWLEILRNIIGCSLIFVITIGFKTRLFSVIMVFWLLTLNIVFNDFWRHRSASVMYDFKKYDFFQTMTVVGGLIILILIGPGGLSLDEKKKMY